MAMSAPSPAIPARDDSNLALQPAAAWIARFPVGLWFELALMSGKCVFVDHVFRVAHSRAPLRLMNLPVCSRVHVGTGQTGRVEGYERLNRWRHRWRNCAVKATVSAGNLPVEMRYMPHRLAWERQSAFRCGCGLPERKGCNWPTGIGNDCDFEILSTARNPATKRIRHAQK